MHAMAYDMGAAPLEVASVVFLMAFGVLAAIDGVYLHLWRLRLPARPSSYVEHLWHTASAVLFVPVVGLLGAFTESSVAGSDGGSVLVTGLVAAAWAAVAVVVVVTVGFVVVERLVPAREWTLDDLPDDTDERRIAFADVVLEAVAVLVAFGIAVWQRVWPPIETSDGTSVPILQPELWDLWIWVLFGLCAMSVLVLALAYRRGRWSLPLAVANLVVDAALLVLIVWLAATDRVLNPVALDAIAEQLEVQTLAAVPTLLIALIGGVALLVDAAGPLRAARR